MTDINSDPADTPGEGNPQAEPPVEDTTVPGYGGAAEILDPNSDVTTNVERDPETDAVVPVKRDEE